MLKAELKMTDKQLNYLKALMNNDKIKLEQALVELSSDVNIPLNQNGETLLISAAQIGDLEQIKILCEVNGIDINQKSNLGTNAFWEASVNGQCETMIYLHKLGIDMLSCNGNGSNALHMAVKNNQLQVVQTLINLKFPINLAKNNGVTAISIAAMNNQLNLVQLLHKNGADLFKLSSKGISPLAFALKGNAQDCIKYLTENGSSQIIPSEKQNTQSSPLFLSIASGNLENFKTLYEKFGGQTDIDSIVTSNGFTLLTYAGYMKQPHILNYLSLRVKDLNQCDPLGYTSLSRCLQVKAYETVKRLVSRGVDINQRNKNNRTPLTLAVMEDDFEAAEYLLSVGADPHVLDSRGKDSCDYALESNQCRKFKEFHDCPLLKNDVEIKQTRNVGSRQLRKESYSEYKNHYDPRQIIEQIIPGTIFTESSYGNPKQIKNTKFNWASKKVATATQNPILPSNRILSTSKSRKQPQQNKSTSRGTHHHHHNHQQQEYPYETQYQSERTLTPSKPMIKVRSIEQDLAAYKNKLDSYFGDKKDFTSEKRALEAQKGELARQRMEENLNKLRIQVEYQLGKPTNEVETQTIKEQGVSQNAVKYNNSILDQISKRLYDEKVSPEEYQRPLLLNSKLPPIFAKLGNQAKRGHNPLRDSMTQTYEPLVNLEARQEYESPEQIQQLSDRWSRNKEARVLAKTHMGHYREPSSLPYLTQHPLQPLPLLQSSKQRTPLVNHTKQPHSHRSQKALRSPKQQQQVNNLKFLDSLFLHPSLVD